MVDEVLLTITVIFGELFFLICDYNSIKEILKFTRSAHQLRRWSHEIFGYEFIIVHHFINMIKDIDTLFRNIKFLIHQYLITVSITHYDYLKAHPVTYTYDVFQSYLNPHHVKYLTSILIQPQLHPCTFYTPLHSYLFPSDFIYITPIFFP